MPDPVKKDDVVRIAALSYAADDTTRSKALYERSKTYLSKRPSIEVIVLRIVTVTLLAVFFLIAVPLLNANGVMPDYKLNLLGKYLCFCIVALGIDLIWGYTGLLSLCQALFFCLGAYAMSMHLSLPQGGGDVRPEYNNIPQFMFFNNVRQLPFFWKPFESLSFAMAAGIFIPGIAATVFGFFIFRSRVRGVYFAIITQAVAWGAWLLISRNEMLLGGTNGLTNFYKPLTESRVYIRDLYFLTLIVVVLSYAICRLIAQSRLGRILVAVRDKETRLYFSGYRPYAFKVFAFAVAAMLAGIGGMLYAPQMGIVTPQNMNTQASIDMVIWVALGGRGKLWGAIFGTLMVSYSLNTMTSDMPKIWPFIQGGMYLAVVLFLPDGIVGLWNGAERRINEGSRWWRSAPVLASLACLTVFVLTEAVGVIPHWLSVVVYQSERLGSIELKYLLLAVALVACGTWQSLSDRQIERSALRKSLAMQQSETTAVQGA